MPRPIRAGASSGMSSLAEGVGFEPTVGKPTPVFKTGTFVRSVIPPKETLVDDYFFLWRR
jgi:hypothetical protein